MAAAHMGKYRICKIILKQTGKKCKEKYRRYKKENFVIFRQKVEAKMKGSQPVIQEKFRPDDAQNAKIVYNKDTSNT